MLRCVSCCVVLCVALQGYILKCLISPDVQQLATASSDKTVKLWNVDGFSLDRTLTGDPQYRQRLSVHGMGLVGGVSGVKLNDRGCRGCKGGRGLVSVKYKQQLSLQRRHKCLYHWCAEHGG